MSASSGRASFSDPAFVARVQAGDREALGQIVHAYLDQIYRAALGAGLERQQAEDVTQATFTTFIESAGRFEGRSHVRTWLFGILYKKVAEARRQLQKDSRQDDIDRIVERRFRTNGHWHRPPEAADRPLQNEEIRKHIEECLEEVPTNQRLAFVLREVEGLASQEICKALQVSLTNLGVLLFRVRNRLRECLEKRGVDG